MTDLADGQGRGTPALLLGPVLRHVDATSATVWVETDRPATVRLSVDPALAVAAHPAPGAPPDAPESELRVEEPTWSVHGHHYAILVLNGLAPASSTPYSVSLGPHPECPADTGDRSMTRVWPPTGDWTFPPSTIRTARGDSTLRLAFGSCRRSEPLDDQGVRDVGPDALVALALRLSGSGSDAEQAEPWPDVLLMIGDQLYADEPSPAIVERLHTTQRGAAEQGKGAEDVRDEICTFEEYTWLYSESWSPEPVRWLLSSVPTCMLLDDHDLRDDWNTSLAWRQEFSKLPWFSDRVKGALGSYWVYQHLGNLGPTALESDPLLKAVRAAGSDEEASRLVDDFALEADADPTSARWSYVRDFGGPEHGVRLVAVDCRCSRSLAPDERGIVDDVEWTWLKEQLTAAPEGGRTDHLLLASTLPVLMVPGFSDVESWNEAVAAGRWGRWAAGWGEKIRRATDLEHWAAFRSSLDALLALLRDIVDGTGPASGAAPPRSILMLAGDVHCSYTARAQLDGGDHSGTAVHQLVMSPFRNPLKPVLRFANRLVVLGPVRRATRALAASAGVPWPAAQWDVDDGPWFENGVMTVVLDGPAATLEIDHVRADRKDPAGRWERRTTRRQLTP